MASFFDALLGQPLAALFLVVGLGLLLGNITVKGVNLGSSAVLFTALLAGHLGYGIPEGVGTLGLVLFVYCVGIGAGGRFFSAIAREGRTLAKLAGVIVVFGGGLAWVMAEVWDIPAALAAGIFAGALTSTPALAAASEGLRQLGGEGGLVIGYGIAYPFGVIGVVLFVQVLPRLLRRDLEKEAAAVHDPREEEQRVETELVEVANPNLSGQRISESGLANFNACQPARILKDGKLVPLSYEDRFEPGQRLLLVGRPREMKIAIDYVGQRVDNPFLKDVENERRQVLVTKSDFAGRTLRELAPLKHFGVVVTRIHRLGLTFVPNAQTVVETNDQLTVVGRAEDLQRFAEACGHRSSAIGETDLLSLSLGLAIGIVLGQIPIGLAESGSITLGLAGGPLIAGLLLGHFGRVGRIVGHIPRPTRVLLQEFGLVLFLADAGVRGGSALVETLQAQGAVLFLMGVAITLVPMLLALPLATRLFKMNFLQALGGICGGMTSTPALGAITARTESQAPVVSYATAYPVALILMTVAAKVLLQLIGV